MSEQAAETVEIGPPWGGVRRVAFRIDMLIGHTVEFIGAILVLAEKVIPAGRVVSRIAGAGLLAGGAWLLVQAFPQLGR